MVKKTRVATSVKDLHKFYLHGKKSIDSNIPCPSIHFNEGHAWTSARQVIEIFLAHGLIAEDIVSNVDDAINDANSQKKIVHTIKETPAAKKIIELVKSRLTKQNDINDSLPLILCVILWLDDFEANDVKKNCKSVWVKTMTICPPPALTSCPHYTHALALGRKGEDHEMVESFIWKELDALKEINYFHHNFFKRNVPVVVEVLAISADSPERSSINKMLCHSGMTSKRWMHSAYIDTSTLPSCDDCFQKRINAMTSVDNHQNNPSQLALAVCKHCGDWLKN